MSNPVSGGASLLITPSSLSFPLPLSPPPFLLSSFCVKVLVARLVHVMVAPDTDTQYRFLVLARKYFGQASSPQLVMIVQRCI